MILKKILIVYLSLIVFPLFSNESNLSIENKYGCIISDIHIEKAVKTKGIQEILESYKGAIYTVETQQTLVNALEAYPSIIRVSISSTEIEDERVRLNLDIIENNAQIFGIMADTYLYTEPDDSITYSISPMFLYKNVNFLGHGLDFQVVYAGAYLKTDLLFPEFGNSDWDFGISLDAMPYPAEIISYEKGDSNWKLKQSYGNAKILLQRECAWDGYVRASQNFNFHNYSSDEHSFSAPGDNYTFTGDLTMGYSTLSQSGSSVFSKSEGILFEYQPAIVYHLNYEEWGYNDELFEHNDLPAYKGNLVLKYASNLGPYLNLGLQISYLHGGNLYELDKWSVGQTSPFDPSPRLNGFYKDEFRTSGSPLLNFDCRIVLPNNRIGFLLQHDSFYYEEQDSYFHGSLAGIAFKLGNSFELLFYNSVGWNTNHETQMTWVPGLTLTYTKIK